MVVFIGADVHKNSHTFVAVDAGGKRIGQITVAAKSSGHEKAYVWARKSFKYAMFAGCAPIPVWSGKTQGRVRLNRGGNRQLNCALHRIAVTQIRIDSPGKEYYERLLTSGKTKTEALRCLKTAIARRIWRTMSRTRNSQSTETPHPAASAACVSAAA